MAFAHGKYSLNVTLVDQGNHKTNLRMDLQGANIAAAEANAVTVLGRLIAVTDAWIPRYTVEDVFVSDVLFTAAEPHGKVSDRALITVQLTTPGKAGTLEIPCPKDAIFVAASGEGYEQVDPTNVDVSNYLNLSNAAAQTFISDGENTINGPFIKGRRVGRHNTGG